MEIQNKRIFCLLQEMNTKRTSLGKEDYGRNYNHYYGISFGHSFIHGNCLWLSIPRNQLCIEEINEEDLDPTPKSHDVFWETS